jgi:hypothetical protein
MRTLHARFGEDALPEAIAASAEALLADCGWVGEMIAPLLADLAAVPFFEPPLRTRRDGMRIGMTLFENPALSIGAAVTSAEALAGAPPTRSVIVPGRITLTRYVLAGGARRRLWRTTPAGEDFRADAAPPCREVAEDALADGAVVRLDGRCEGQTMVPGYADIVTISATVRRGASPYVREYAVAGGRLIRAAMLDERPARTQMLLAFLRANGRGDAGGCFEEATRDPAFHLRWSAMREWLATDAHAALPRLAALAADDPHAEVRAAARATLAKMEPVLCPA